MRIAVNGACGRMGQTVLRLAREMGIEVAEAIDVAPAPPGLEVSRSLTKKVDALVDFSTPEASLERLAECVRSGTPAVIGTTGFTDAQRARIAEAARAIPVVLSSNTSVGVNLLFKLVPEVARVLGKDYDIDIVETHHRFKKDAPSGTAKTLAERIEAATGRRPNVHAVRSGDVVGEHRVLFGSIGDSIEIVHRASSRDIFARGALEAARWVARARPGLHSMLEVLGSA
ncbi:MAG TPA: 4-hydroxy-tetrahydrodipicolinate reductase [Planctomycetota bacterium]|nr:4-hydroxy-tetrahydrodipicolinate reductase [Planctomycetota bacterium]